MFYVLVFQTNHMRCLTDFVEAQACYFDQCNQHAQELQRQLARSVSLVYSRKRLNLDVAKLKHENVTPLMKYTHNFFLI